MKKKKKFDFHAYDVDLYQEKRSTKFYTQKLFLATKKASMFQPALSVIGRLIDTLSINFIKCGTRLPSKSIISQFVRQNNTFVPQIDTYALRLSSEWA